MQHIQNLLKLLVSQFFNTAFFQSYQDTSDIISISDIRQFLKSAVFFDELLHLFQLSELFGMDAKQGTELVFVVVEEYLKFLVKNLLSLDEGLFQWYQAQTVLDQACTVLLFLVYILYHLDEQVLFL